MAGSADPNPKKDPKKDPEGPKDPQENDVRKDSTPAGATRENDASALLTVEEMAARLAGFTGPCAVAGIPLRGLVVPGPGGIDPARVRVAGSLMSTYLYGMRLMFFPAVDRARELLDTQDLCLERDVDDGPTDRVTDRVTGNALRNALYCWPDRYDRVTPLQRATLVAQVLGQPHPDVPAEQVNAEIEPLLRNMFGLINSVCDPGLCRTDPTPATEDALRLARESVRYQLSRSVTELTAMRVRDLQDQLHTAVVVLTSLADRIASPCRTQLGADIWAGLDRLVGPQLRADKIDVMSVAHAAEAWQTVFAWLAADIADDDLLKETRPLCGAVSRLQAPRQTGGCACTATGLTCVS